MLQVVVSGVYTKPLSACLVQFTLWLILNVGFHNNSRNSLYFRFEEIVKRNKVEYHAGGSTQNSVKIAQVSLLWPSAVCLNVF